jgi:hypothetical protein
MNTQELLDPQQWAERTFGASNCMICVAADARSKRKAELAENPLGTLPAHMQTWKETKALYRLRRSSQTSPLLP